MSKWSDFPYAKQRVYYLFTCELSLAPVQGVVSLAAIGRLNATLSVSLAVLGLVLPVAAQDRPNEEAVTVTLNEVDDSGVSGVAMVSANGGQMEVEIRLARAFERHANHVHKNFCDNVIPDPLFPLTLGRTESASRDRGLSLG